MYSIPAMSYHLVGIAEDGTEDSLHSPSLGLKLTLSHPVVWLQYAQQPTADLLCIVLNSVCKSNCSVRS